jgi:hypothetical protein
MVKTLDEQIEEDLKKLDEPVEEESTPEEIEEEEPSEEEAPVEDEPKEEPKKEEPPVDQNAMAQMRYENSRLKRELEEKNKPKEVREEEKIPDPNEDPIAYLAWENRKLKEEVGKVSKWTEEQESKRKQEEFYQAQVRGFNIAEEQFKKTTSDYDDVSAHMVAEMRKGFRAIHPFATDQQIDSAVASKILEMAEQAAQAGYQPAGYLYNMSKERYGYKPKEQERPVARKPDLSVVDKNKKKSANGLSGTGSKSALTIEQLEKMSIRDMEDYAEEVDELLYRR